MFQFFDVEFPRTSGHLDPKLNVFLKGPAILCKFMWLRPDLVSSAFDVIYLHKVCPNPTVTRTSSFRTFKTQNLSKLELFFSF